MCLHWGNCTSAVMPIRKERQQRMASDAQSISPAGCPCIGQGPPGWANMPKLNYSANKCMPVTLDMLIRPLLGIFFFLDSILRAEHGGDDDWWRHRFDSGLSSRTRGEREGSSPTRSISKQHEQQEWDSASPGYNNTLSNRVTYITYCITSPGHELMNFIFALKYKQ